MAGTITLDGLNMKTTYGVIALRGSYNDLVRMPDLKEPSSYSWPTENFDDADLTNRKIASRDISLTFLLSKISWDDSTDVLSLRDALFNALKADGERVLYVGHLDRSFHMYYKGCESVQYISSGAKRIKMVLKFRLNSI